MNTECSQIIPYLNRYRDGEADEGLCQKIQVHLSQCPGCTIELHLLDQVTTAVKNLPSIEPPLNFTAQVMSRIKETEKTRWFSLRFVPSLAYSFVFIIFCILGLLLNPQLKIPKIESVPAVNAADYTDSPDYPTFLAESQQLNLIEIQDKTFEMVYNGDYN
jgi:hypothetical protein